MSRIWNQFDLGTTIVAGLVAGVALAGFETMATSLSGAGTAEMPLQMAAAMVLGRRALAPDYPFLIAGIVGVAVYLVVSVALAILFATIVSWISTVTKGELLTTSVELILAGVIFAVAAWLFSFYVVARWAGWTWFPERANNTIAFLGNGIFFGGVLGVALSRFRVRRLRGA